MLDMRRIAVLLTLSVSAAFAEPSLPTVNVNTAAVKMVKYRTPVTLTGDVTARLGATLAPEVSGRVTYVSDKNGQDIHKNDRVLQLNPNIIQGQLKSAEAELTLNLKNYERSEKLVAKGSISQSDLDSARAAYENSVGQVDTLKAQLQQTEVAAPFDGRLGLITYHPGDYVVAGTAITTLEQLSPIWVDFDLPQNYLPVLHVGDPINITQGKSKPITATVASFDSSINQTTRTIKVRSVLPNKDQSLLPGGFVTVSAFLGKPQMLASIPQTALVPTPDGTTVFVVKGGKALQTPVTLGLQTKDRIIVTSGLQKGDVVITDGIQNVQNGFPVNPLNHKTTS